MNALTVHLNSIISLSDEQYFQLCQANRDLRFERTATGELIIMPPTGGETGNRNAAITAQLWIWNDQKKLGKVFDSSTGFRLPNSAFLSPDAAWIKLERWDTLTASQKQKFIPLCPDFVIELLSPSDRTSVIQDKMLEYLANGTQLGWLIDRKSQQVEIYRANTEVEIIVSPNTLLGETVLPGFVLNLEQVW
ncbi:MAG: Uma2 family endonuclease [Chroococcus sp. CMT-3BRIN-NPC107]|jgi:Uma2 family endonuclease|nr:Uma2 family endonuclease [Chroococcus sp. CMT-3BRIN-NPC107]